MTADGKHAARTEAMLRSIAELDARTDVGDANIDRMLMDQFELPFNDAEAI